MNRFPFSYRPAVGLQYGLSVFLIGLALAGCGEGQPVGPAERELNPASKPSSGDPTVKATDPTGAPVDTTLTVRVLGTGYDAGSVAEFALDGQSVPQVRTNSTTFVSSKELRANITIDADAPTDLYDVIVTTSKGKRGIGIERFEVFYAATNLGTLGGWSRAYAVNANGEVTGESTLRRQSGRSHVFFWSAAGGMEDLGEGEAEDISDGSDIVGERGYGASQATLWTRLDPGGWSPEYLPVPSGQESRTSAISPSGTYISGMLGAQSPYENPALWVRDGTGWSLTILPHSGTEVFTTDVNNDGVVLGSGANQAFVWLPVAGTWVMHSLEIPADSPGGVDVLSINSAGDVLGTTCCIQDQKRPLIWRRTPSGWSSPEDVPGVPPGYAVTSMNDSGQVSGAYLGTSGQWRAYVCCSGGVKDLGAPGGGSGVAHQVGAGGHVVGESGTSTRAYLWSVP